MNNAGLFFFYFIFLSYLRPALLYYPGLHHFPGGENEERLAGPFIHSSSRSWKTAVIFLPTAPVEVSWSVTSASDPLTGERTCYGPFNSWGLFVITHMKSPWIGVRSLLLLSAGLMSYQALVTAGATGPAHVQLNALKPLYLLALAFFFFFFFFFVFW